MMKSIFASVAVLLLLLSLGSCRPFSSASFSPIGSLDLDAELTKAVINSGTTNQASGSGRGQSDGSLQAEAQIDFAATDDQAHAALKAVHDLIDPLAGAASGRGVDGDPAKDVQCGYNWHYKINGKNGSLWLKLFQLSPGHWTLQAFNHEA